MDQPHYDKAMDHASTEDKQPTILLLSGSPRFGGASEQLLQAIFEGAQSAGAEATMFLLSRNAIGPCTDCRGCDKTGMCIIDDPMSEFLELADTADALVVVSPLFFADVPAGLKALYDRLQQRWIQNYKLKRERGPKKPALLCLVGAGGDPYGDEPAQITSRSALAMLEFRIDDIQRFIGFDAADKKERTRFLERARSLGFAFARELLGQ